MPRITLNNFRHARAGGHPILSKKTKWDPRLRGGDGLIEIIRNDYRSVALILLLILCCAPAAACNYDDMFDNYGIGRVDPGQEFYRPQHSADLFPNRQAYVRENKDMFDRVTPPGDIGIEDMFSAPKKNAPPTPLFNWSKGEPGE
jgi:hypothetical protein